MNKLYWPKYFEYQEILSKKIFYSSHELIKYQIMMRKTVAVGLDALCKVGSNKILINNWHFMPSSRMLYFGNKKIISSRGAIIFSEKEKEKNIPLYLKSKLRCFDILPSKGSLGDLYSKIIFRYSSTPTMWIFSDIVDLSMTKDFIRLICSEYDYIYHRHINIIKDISYARN